MSDPQNKETLQSAPPPPAATEESAPGGGDPVQALKDRLNAIAMDRHADFSPWENAFYALVCAKEPGAEIYKILEAMPYRDDYTDKMDLLNTLANLNYYAKNIKGTLKGLDSRLLPCLMEPKNGDEDLYVVIRRTQKGWLAYNATKETYEEIAPKSPEAKKPSLFWLFEKYDESKSPLSKFMRKATGHSWFGALLSRFRSTLMQIFLVGFILNIFALAPPIFIMVIYDKILSTGSVSTLLMLAAGMIIALITEWFLRQMRSRALSWLTARLDNIVGNKIFGHMINLKPELIENASVTGQIARIKTFESARDFFSGGVFLSAIELPFTFISLCLISILAGPLAMVPAGMALVLLAQYFIMRRMLLLRIRKSARAGAIKQQFLLETFERINTIRAVGMQDLWYQKYRDLSGKESLAYLNMIKLSGMTEIITQTLSMAALVLLIGYGTHLIWSGVITTGGLVASMILIWRVLGPFQSLCLSIPRIEQLKGSLSQVNSLMDLESEEIINERVARLSKMRGKIAFQNVTMRYSETGDYVHKDLSFSLEPGETLAITGPSGTGKSTIFKLIQRMYNWQSGTIMIDDFDVYQLDVHDIRRNISYIPQIHDFFHGSIIDNIRVGNPMAGEKEVKEALEFSGALKEIMAMPETIYTPIQSVVGDYMSPSLAFRLAVSRAYVQKAPIICIDELPYEFQDGEMGDLLRKTIARMGKNKTILFVTYRRDFMILADRLLTLTPNQPARFEPIDVLYDAKEE